MAGTGDKLLTAAEIKAVTDTKVDKVDMETTTLNLSLFTNIDSHLDTTRFFRRRIGNTIYLNLAINGGITNGTRLFTIDNSILPIQQNVVCPIFSSSGAMIVNASVWIEANDTSKATFYGTTLSSGLYFVDLTYVK